MAFSIKDLADKISVEPKTRTILNGQVVISFFPYKCIHYDRIAQQLSDDAEREFNEKKVAKSEAEVPYLLCELMAYSVDMQFKWASEDVDFSVRAIEAVWTSYKNHEPISDIVSAVNKYMNSSVLIAWNGAKISAHKIWKPESEKTEEDKQKEGEAGEETDPNFQKTESRNGAS